MAEQHDSKQALANCKHLYWLQMPTTINDDFKIELLKRDIFAHRIFCRSLEDLELSELPSAENGLAIYFFNIDEIFSAEIIKAKHKLYAACKILAKKINAFVPHRCIVHSNLIDNKIKEIFNNEKIILLQKNMHNHRLALTTILNLTPIILGDQGREKRGAIRITTYPENKIKVQAKKLVQIKGVPEKVFTAWVKDLSLNGMALVFDDEAQTEAINLKEPMALKVSLPRAIFRITTAFVVRKETDKKEIGLSFNLLNHKMVSEDDATVLSSYIYSCLKGYLKTQS